MMPTSEQLNEAALLMFATSLDNLSLERRAQAMQAVQTAQRNSILGDIVTTLDRIQTDIGAIAHVAWNK